MNCKIEENQMLLMLNSLKTCSNLKILNLSENPLKNSSKILAKTLQVMTNIEVVALNNSKIGHSGFKTILQELKDKIVLKGLYLSGNEISDEGMAQTKTLLASDFKELKTLHLVNNNITEKGGSYFSVFLKLHTRLENLRLGNNKLKGKGIYYVLVEINGINQLNALDVGNNEIGDDGALEIEKFLNRYQKLAYLNVMNNEISEESIISIRNILKKQSTHCKINVFGNNANDFYPKMHC